eukprot:1137056-Pelagomonas_calceolata.AAC.4
MGAWVHAQVAGHGGWETLEGQGNTKGPGGLAMGGEHTSSTFGEEGAQRSTRAQRGVIIRKSREEHKSSGLIERATE